MKRLAGLSALAVIVYVGLSVALVATPLLYRGWKQKFAAKFPFSMANIAHRGGAMRAPENTLCAFVRCLAEGHANMLELDVRVSKDG